MEINSKALLTATEASQMGIASIHTLNQRRHQKRGIPWVRVGRAVRYKLTDVENWLDENRVETSIK